MFAKSKIQALGLLAAVAVASFAAGATINRADATTNPTDWRERCSYSGMLKDRLGLSEAQRDSIRTLMRSQRPAMRALVAPLQPQMDSLRAITREQVRAVLTPEQRMRHDSLMAAEREERSRDSSAATARGGF